MIDEYAPNVAETGCRAQPRPGQRGPRPGVTLMKRTPSRNRAAGKVSNACTLFKRAHR